MQKIYLDDLRTPKDTSWIICRNYDEFVTAVSSIGLDGIEVISLDHDLGKTAIEEYYRNVQTRNIIDYDNIEEKTGYDCAKWLVELSAETNTPLPLVYTHSANSVGYVNIMTYINNYLKHCGLPETCERVRIPHSIQEKE
jgi:hypothetical protein